MGTFRVTGDLEKNVFACKKVMNERINKFLTVSKESQLLKTLAFLGTDDAVRIRELEAEAEAALIVAQDKLLAIENYFSQKYDAYITAKQAPDNV